MLACLVYQYSEIHDLVSCPPSLSESHLFVCNFRFGLHADPFFDLSALNSQQTPSVFVSLHTHPFNGPLSGTTRVSRYQKGKSNLDFTEARDSEWQWHQLGHMQVCTALQTDSHASTPSLSFLQAGCPSCRPTNSIKALTAKALSLYRYYIGNLVRCSSLKQ